MKTPSILFIFVICWSESVYLQESPSKLLWGELHYGIQSPFGALNDRFGLHFDVGSRAGIILPSGFSLSFNYQFLFGSNVKEDVLLPLRRTDGSIISNVLTPTFPSLKLRGHAFHLLFGKWLRQNDLNQGWWIKAGPGFLQHKILIQDDADPLAQLQGALRKGYDRLSNGYGAAASFGYLYISPTRQINIYAAIQGGLYSVTNQRGYNIDTQKIDDQANIHSTLGITLGWIIPIFMD